MSDVARSCDFGLTNQVCDFGLTNQVCDFGLTNQVRRNNLLTYKNNIKMVKSQFILYVYVKRTTMVLISVAAPRLHCNII